MMKSIVKLLSNVQTQSALIWAAMILGCSFVSGSQDVFSILIIGAGFHIGIMSKFDQKTRNSASCKSIN